MMDNRRNSIAERDERTVTVENASYRLGYVVAMFAILLSVMYRSFYRNDPSWDLLAIVILSGAVVSLYQARHRIISRGWIRLAVLTLLAGAVVAVFVVLVMRMA